MNLPNRHFTPVVKVAGGIKHVLFDSTEKDAYMLLIFSQTIHMPFPFADCALYPFTIINGSLEYNYMLSPLSLLVNPQRVVLRGSPTHMVFSF